MRTKSAWNAVRNILAGVLTGYGAAALAAYFVISGVWVRAAPRSPDLANGWVVPHNEHGSITYLSVFQSTSCALLFLTSIPLILVALFVRPKRTLVWENHGLAFRVNWDPDDPRSLHRVGLVLGLAAAAAVIFGVGGPFVTWLNSQGFSLRL